MQRREGLAKLSGREQYVDDLAVDGCLWGMTVRSPAPRGKIQEIRRGDGVNWSEFVVVDHRDIPGPNELLLIERDQPVLAAEADSDPVLRPRTSSARTATAPSAPPSAIQCRLPRMCRV